MKIFILSCMLAMISLSSMTQADDSFSYLLLAQFWPPTSCIYFEEKQEGCYIPPNIKSWTIHGLWPSRPGSEGPEGCNDSMAFDFSQIQDLGPELYLKWHLYEKNKDSKSLWEHEWNKHGTCAFSLPEIRGELLYFNKTLNLYSQLNIAGALAKGGVVPSTSKRYNMKDINKAVKDFYKVEPVIVCNYDGETRNTYLEQVYLCYDKSFNLQDCYEPAIRAPPFRPVSKVSYYSKCEAKDEIQYLPFRDVPSAKKDSRLVFESEKNRG